VKLQNLGVNCELQLGCDVSSTGGLKFLFVVADFCKPNMIFASNFSWIILHTPPTNHPSAGADEKSVLGGGSHGKLVHSFFMIKKMMV
jgi:hypothetical protein